MCVPSGAATTAAAARWSPATIGRRASSTTAAAPRRAVGSRAANAAVGGMRMMRVANNGVRVSSPTTSSYASSSSSSSSVVSARLRRAAPRRLNAVTDPAAATPEEGKASDEAGASMDDYDDGSDGSEYDQVGGHQWDLPKLQASSSSRENRFDLTIVGCGPAGLSAADRASSKARGGGYFIPFAHTHARTHERITSHRIASRLSRLTTLLFHASSVRGISVSRPSRIDTRGFIGSNSTSTSCLSEYLVGYASLNSSERLNVSCDE